MREFVYDVFARKERGEALAHIGYVDALEQNWFEMCVVRRSAIIPVNREDGPFARGGTAQGGTR